MNHEHHYPIYITTGCRNRGPKEDTHLSTAKNIQISNVVANDCDSLCSIIVTGMAGEPIRNVWLNNIRLNYRGGGKPLAGPGRHTVSKPSIIPGRASPGPRTPTGFTHAM